MSSTAAWSSAPSDLPDASRIYNFVVAVTQDSINANLDLFVSENLASPGVTEFLYIYDTSNNLVPISLGDLLAQSNNVNPFTIPDKTPTSDTRIKALSNAGFAFGVQAQIGIPRISGNIPGWVDFSGGSSSSIVFNMMCSTFGTCEIAYGPRGPANWTSFSQTSSQPAIFQATVNLDFTSAAASTSSPVYSNLPQNVKSMIMDVGPDAFSLQQLLFYLSTPGLISTFDLPGFDTSSDTYTLIKSKFLDFYFDQMKAAGTPLLGVSVTRNPPSTQPNPNSPPLPPPSSLQPTSINFEVDPYLNANGTVSTDPNLQGLATLNYLCLMGGKPQLPPDHFKWNWLAPSEETNFDGVVSINCDSLAAYFQVQLLSFVQANCFNITVELGLDSKSQPTYSYTMTPGQTPSFTLNKGSPDGLTALSYDWSKSASDQAGLDGDLGKMTLTQTYHLGMQFIGNTIVVTQTQVVWTSISKNLTTDSGNIVDRSIVDTFTIRINGQGQLVVPPPVTKSTNNDMNPSSNPFVNWFIQINDIISGVENNVRNLVSASFTDVPLSTIQNFVLPGGKSFYFSNVAFAEHSLDLVAKIKYVDPLSINSSN